MTWPACARPEPNPTPWPRDGDRHIEAIVRDCLARRQPADVVRVRLLVASDVARVLDDESAKRVVRWDVCPWHAQSPETSAR